MRHGVVHIGWMRGRGEAAVKLPFQKRVSTRRKVAGAAVLLAVLAVPVVSWDRTANMPGESFSGSLPGITPAQLELALGLSQDVEHLAVTIGERNLQQHGNLERAADWIDAELRKASYEPDRQTYEVDGKPCHNIEVVVSEGAARSEIIVVGAHYDSAIGTPGANDNGSGVASLLALARRMRSRASASGRTLRFVWFTNEEPPHFQGENMGSVRYARRARQRGEDIVAMLSLETMGYFSDEPGSQRYPPPIQALYPDTGNFIAFVGDTQSRDLVRRVLAVFRKHAQFPSEGAALPGRLPGAGWSDHWSFWQEDYRAVMVSDTAPFRYEHYHTAQDTPDKIDYERLARVVDGIEEVIVELVANGVH